MSDTPTTGRSTTSVSPEEFEHLLDLIAGLGEYWRRQIEDLRDARHKPDEPAETAETETEPATAEQPAEG